MTFDPFIRIFKFLLSPMFQTFGVLEASIIGGTGLAGAILGQPDAPDIPPFSPPGIRTGTGTTTFTPEEGFVSELSPELQELRDLFVGRARTGFEGLGGFDPEETGRLFTSRLQELAAPQERRERLNLENRLFRQGLLGSTTGRQRSQSLLEAQALKDLARETQGFEAGQAAQDRLFRNVLGSIQAGTTLDQLNAQQLNQAIAAGGAQTSTNLAGAQFQFAADQSRGDAISSFFNQLGTGFSRFAFDDPTPTPAPFNPFAAPSAFAVPSQQQPFNPQVFT